MKTLPRLLTLSAAFIAVPLFAGTSTRSVSTSAETTAAPANDGLSYEFDIEDAYVGDGDVTRGSRDVREFDENNFLARFIFTPRVKFGILRIGAEYERYDFGMPDFSQLPDTLQSAALVIGLDTEFSDSFLIRFEAHPGFYSSSNLDSSDFNAPMILGGSYIYSSNLQFVFGVGINYDAKYPVLPGGGIRWRFASQWVLNAVLPKPRLEFEATKNLTLYAGAEIKSGTYRVDDDFGDINGPSRLNHAILSYSEVRTGVGLEWKVASALKLGIEGGYQPYRDFDYYRANIRYHEDGGAPYGAISFHAAF